MPPRKLVAHDQRLDTATPASAGAGAHATSARADRAESDAQLDEVAAAVQAERGHGSSMPADTRAAAEGSLGHDLSAVRVHTGPVADELNHELGSKAFTSGRDIFYRGDQDPGDLQLAMHEATHAVQQGMSEDRPAALGDAASAHEHAADRADAAPGSVGPTIQRYTDDKRIADQYARVSDQGNIIVLGESNFSQNLYATADKIDEANDALASSGDKGSYLRLIRHGGAISWGGKQLDRIAPVFKPQGDGKNAKLAAANKGKDEDDTMSLWADCGRSSRAVMGSHGDAAPHATYRDGDGDQETAAAYNPAAYSDEIYLAAMPDFLRDPASAEFLKEGVHYQNGDKSDVIVPTTADQARAQYIGLSHRGRRAFDRYAGINTAADPSIGGGYTMNTEYDMPGFKEKGEMTWNFHWAGVVMKDGTDNVTLENYADGKGYESINTDWNFQMYGTVKKGQTFHEQHLATGTHGTRASTFAVEPKGS